MDGSGTAVAAPAPRELFGELYQELRQIARRQLRIALRQGSLATTALVNEAYLRLGGGAQFDFRGRSQFMALCAQVMRQVLLDRARLHAARKRGGDLPGRVEEEIDALPEPIERERELLIDLDAALSRMAEEDPRIARVAELRLFGGYSVEETAQLLGVSTPTVKRDTQLARLYLIRELDLAEVAAAAEAV